LQSTLSKFSGSLLTPINSISAIAAGKLFEPLRPMERFVFVREKCAMRQ
jgi:hypothetical protein